MAAAEEIIPGYSINVSIISQNPVEHAQIMAAFNYHRTQFRNYLNTIGPRQIVHLHHPGLNCRFGFEIEFCSSSNRYVIANRVNSCMWNQNGRWWLKNFNALGPILPDLPGDGRELNDDVGAGTDFNQWSSFFLEVAQDYHAPSHRGDERCENTGNAGCRIENDISVSIENEGPGITLWSVKAPQYHQGTELKSNPADPDRWNNSTRGLRVGVVEPNYDQVSQVCSSHTLRPGEEWNIVGNPETNLFFYEFNELVSNVLTNVHVSYPHGINTDEMDEDELIEKQLPLGGLLIDNLCNHMLSHSLVLATQRMGFHIHLSEYPRIENEVERQQMIVGFVKLFYLFEPLFYAFHPRYRSESDYCQSIQSIFTKDEIRTQDIGIWTDLVGDIPVSGTNRKLRGDRYLSLNLTNCVEGGIGTIEIRLGHSTFDSQYIQAYINILQTLLRLNQSIMNADAINHRTLFQTHNELLNFTPYYCNQSSDQYDNLPARGKITPENTGRPIFGFFTSCGNSAQSRVYKTNFIKTSLQMFQALTGSSQALSYLVSYINQYHATTRAVGGWLSDLQMNPIDFDASMSQINSNLGFGPLVDLINAESFNNFIPVGVNQYRINGGWQYNLDHDCKTCSRNPAGACAPDYNDGDYPAPSGEGRGQQSYYDRVSTEGTVYTKRCDGEDWTGKFQTELINYKTAQQGAMHNFYRGGGKKRKTRGQRKNWRGRNKKRFTKKRGGGSRMNTSNQTDESEYEKFYRVNQGAERVVLRENNGVMEVGYGNWMGGFTADSKLTSIVATLLKQNIIDRETLDILLKNKYIDTYVYCVTTDLHKRKLIQELSKFNISPQKIDQIRQVYMEFNSQKNRTSQAQSPSTVQKTRQWTQQPKSSSSTFGSTIKSQQVQNVMGFSGLAQSS